MTKYWGPIYWYFLHTLIDSYSETPNNIEKSLYQQMLVLFVKIIPCNICRIHFFKLLKDRPPNMISKEEFIQWGFNIHNKVNIRLKKTKLEFKDFKDLHGKINHKHLYDFIIYNQKRAYHGEMLFNDFILLINLLVLVFPCSKCRKSYQYQYKKDNMSQVLLSKISLSKWIKRYIKPEGLHIKINKIVKKKQ
jgi:hypothetical protein